MTAEKKPVKPVWLDEEAHLILKQYARVLKSTMTEVTSQLVLDKIPLLDGATPVAAAPAAAAPAVTAAPVAAAAAPTPAAAEPAAAARYIETDANTRLEPPRPEPPAPPRRTRAPREKTDEVRYLGGIWVL